MTDSRPVQFSPSGPPETILPSEPPERIHALRQAAAMSGAERIAHLKQLVVADPRSCAGWAALGECTEDPVEAYAYFRVGYHRGLDSLRANGWRGSGFVRWRNESNRGFLTALAGLATTAATIGEVDEAERCELFLRQCDPAWPPADRRSGA